MTIAIIIEFEVKPACRAEFESRLRLDAAQTLHDDGCLRMEILQPRERPDHLVLSELWRDEAAIAAHRDQPGHTHAWQDALLAAKRVTVCDMLKSS